MPHDSSPDHSSAATVDPPFVAETLAWCNEIRASKGEAPLDAMPKGVRDDPESCPCGRATGVYVDHTTYSVSKAAWQAAKAHPLPDPVAEFVAAFDAQALPQYDEEPFDGEEWDG